MALAVAIAGTALHSTTNASTYAVSASVTAGQRCYLFATVDHASAGPTMTPTATGTTFTPLHLTTGGDVWANDATRRSGAWTFIAAATGALTINIATGTAATGLESTCVTVTDVGSSGHVQIVPVDGTTVSFVGTATLAAFASGSNRPLAWFCSNQALTPTAEAGYTAFGAGSHVTPNGASLVEFNASTADTTPSATLASGSQAAYHGYALELIQYVPAVQESTFETGTNGAAVSTSNSSFASVTTSGTGTATITSTTPHHGTLAMQLTLPATSQAYGTYSFPANAQMVYRAYWRWSAFPTAGIAMLTRLRGAAAATRGTLYVDNTGALLWANAAGTAVLTSAGGIVSLNTWYRIEFSATATTVVLRVYVGDSLTASYAPADIASTASGTFTDVLVGKPSNTDTYTAKVDDPAVLDGTTTLLGPSSAGATAVSASLAVSYDVLADVAKSVAVSYDVLADVAKSLAVSWDTAAPVGKSLAGSYDVAAKVGQSRAVSFDVLAPVGLSRSVAWSVQGAVGRSLVASYDVGSAVGRSLAGSFDVAAAVGRSLGVSYDVQALAAVGKSLAVAWDVSGKVGQSRAVSWDVSTSVGLSRAVSWDVLSKVGLSRSVTWRVYAIGQILAKYDADGLADGTVVVVGVVGTGDTPIGGVLGAINSTTTIDASGPRPPRLQFDPDGTQGAALIWYGTVGQGIPIGAWRLYFEESGIDPTTTGPILHTREGSPEVTVFSVRIQAGTGRVTLSNSIGSILAISPAGATIVPGTLYRLEATFDSGAVVARIYRGDGPDPFITLAGTTTQSVYETVAFGHYSTAAWPTRYMDDLRWVYDRVAPGAIESVTTVGRSLAASYDVASKVGASRSILWDVSGKVGQSRAVAFDVLAAVGDPFASSWDVLARVGRSLAASYDVATSVGASLSVVYTVAGKAGASIAASYDVRATAGRTGAFSYDVAAAVGRSIEVDWSVEQVGAVGSSLAASWSVQTSVGKSIGVAWAQLAAVGSSLSVAWSVAGAAGRAIGFAWDVRSTVGRSVGVVYDVQAVGAVGASLVVAYDVRKTVGAPLAASWDLRAATGRTAALSYDVRALASGSLVVSWDVSSTVAVGASLVAAWVVLAAVGRALAARWDVQSSALVVVPPGNVVVVDEEDRTVEVAAERAVVVAAESRLVRVAAEDRTAVVVEEEPRLVAVGWENARP